MTQRFGIDVGNRRIGIAQQQADTDIVTPVCTVYRYDDSDSVEDVIGAINCRDKTEFIIGLPLLMSGKIGTQAKDVIDWSHLLQSRLPDSAIRLVDERLTSVLAHHDLSEAGRQHRQHRTVVDQQAAVIILQHAIHTMAVTGKPAGVALEDMKVKGQ